MSLTNINPVKRLEYFLQDIADGKTTATKTPVRRIEEFMRRCARKNRSQDTKIADLEDKAKIKTAGSFDPNPGLTIVPTTGVNVEQYYIWYNHYQAIINIMVSFPANYEIPTDGLIIATFDGDSDVFRGHTKSYALIGDASGAFLSSGEGYPFSADIRLRRRNFDNRQIVGGMYHVTMIIPKVVES